MNNKLKNEEIHSNKKITFIEMEKTIIHIYKKMSLLSLNINTSIY